MISPEVQTVSSTFYKYWTEHWQSSVESSEYANIFSTMVSQTMRVFGTVIEAEAFVKNLVNKNKGFMTWAIEADVEALKKC